MFRAYALMARRSASSSGDCTTLTYIAQSTKTSHSVMHVSRLCREDRLDEALQFLEVMDQHEMSIPRDIVYDLLQCSSKRKDLVAARQVQSLMVKGGWESVSVLADHLIRLFTLCGSLIEAHEAFCKVLMPSVYTWNSIISAHLKLGRTEKALDLYADMLLDGVKPDKVTFLCILKACGYIRAIDYGQLVHFQLLTGDDYLLLGVSNMLVDMYAKCGRIEEGRKVFDKLLLRDVISWGALMTGYTQEGCDYTALELFEQIYWSNVPPNKVVFLSALKACAGLGSLKHGLLTQHLILYSQVSIDIAIGSMLVDMYAKCGCMVEAQQFFDKLPEKDIKTWGAIMSGYAAFGSCVLVEHCFMNMKKQGLKPDDGIFTSILTSYSHTGLVHEAYQHFQSMTAEYGVKPSTQHYNCMVDLLGRAGYLKEAKGLLDSAPNTRNLVGWLSLLTSCRTYTNPCIGSLCFERVRELEPMEARGYMLMLNIYADANMSDDVERIKKLRIKSCAWRMPGKSSIEIDNKAFEFFVGDRRDPQSEHIFKRINVLHTLMNDEGYVPQLEVVLEPVVEIVKKPG